MEFENYAVLNSISWTFTHKPNIVSATNYYDVLRCRPFELDYLSLWLLSFFSFFSSFFFGSFLSFKSSIFFCLALGVSFSLFFLFCFLKLKFWNRRKCNRKFNDNRGTIARLFFDSSVSWRNDLNSDILWQIGYANVKITAGTYNTVWYRDC